MRPASATLLRRAEAPRQSRLHRLGVPGTAAGPGRELLHGEGVAALQGVEDGLAAWGRIARYRQRRAALLERGEAALVPICPGPLAGDGYLLDEWQSKQALKPFGLPLPQGC